MMYWSLLGLILVKSRLTWEAGKLTLNVLQSTRSSPITNSPFKNRFFLWDHQAATIAVTERPEIEPK